MENTSSTAIPTKSLTLSSPLSTSSTSLTLSSRSLTSSVSPTLSTSSSKLASSTSTLTSTSPTGTTSPISSSISPASSFRLYSFALNFANCPSVTTDCTKHSCIFYATTLYRSLFSLIRSINLQSNDDANRNIVVAIASYFRENITSVYLLEGSLNFINDKALNDAETVEKVALTFASNAFNDIKFDKKTVKLEMLNTLCKTFIGIQDLRENHRNRFYNFILLLSHYYQHVEINVLGYMLCDILTNEYTDPMRINDIILARMTYKVVRMNGRLLWEHSSEKVTKLMVQMQKILIEYNGVHFSVRNLLHMALDEYYNKIRYSDYYDLQELLLQDEMEELYRKFGVI